MIVTDLRLDLGTQIKRMGEAQTQLNIIGPFRLALVVVALLSDGMKQKAKKAISVGRVDEWRMLSIVLGKSQSQAISSLPVRKGARGLRPIRKESNAPC